MTLLYVKPAEGRSVPMPERGGILLPATGEKVPRNAYWLRRLADGDAVTVTTTVAPVLERVRETKTAAKKKGDEA